MTEKDKVLERLAQDFFDEEVSQLLTLIQSVFIDITDPNENHFITNEQRQAIRLLSQKAATYISQCLTILEAENIAISKHELVEAIQNKMWSDSNN